MNCCKGDKSDLSLTLPLPAQFALAEKETEASQGATQCPTSVSESPEQGRVFSFTSVTLPRAHPPAHPVQ